MSMSNRKRKQKNTKTSYSIFSTYHFVYSNMWGYDKKLFGYGIAEIIFNVLMPLGAVIAPAIVIGLLAKKAELPEFIRTIGIVFLIYSILSAIYTFLRARNWYQYIDVRCIKFTGFLFHKCIHMDYDLYENEKVRTDLEKAMDSISTNLRGLEGFMHHNISFITNILELITYTVIISFISPSIMLLLILISVVQLIVYHRAKLYEHNKKDEMAKIEMMQNYLQEQAFDIKAGKDIRLYQLNGLINRFYSTANRGLKSIKARIRRIYYLNDVVSIVLQLFRDAVCYGYLIYLLMHGLEVSSFVLYIGVIRGLADWVMKITDNVSEIGREHLMICDIRSYIDRKDNYKHNSGIEITDEDQALDIVFDHVSFCYDSSEEYVLKDVSFHIRKGDRMALVGINGAGKTTIVKLMCGFYQPTAGRILINGIDMKELNIDSYFKQIAVVFQDAFTLSFTIGENICCTDRLSMNREQLEKAIKCAGLKEKLDSLEKGIDTYLNKDMDDSGIQLSGGELQKLMLARAVYKSAKLLILDEPTAALDAIAESELYEKYQKLLQGKSALFISHRLASTRFCNHILLLENGRIAEKGTHETLMALNGRYTDMFHVQSQYYEEDEYEIQESMA